jgi:muramoyltetrapeptide carboxypeptidase
MDPKMINRKVFLKQLGLISALSFAQIPFIKANSVVGHALKPNKIIPKRLEKGDTIGLIAPSGVLSEERFKKMLENIEALGYKPYSRHSILSEFGYLAGRDRERADELVHMFENKDVDAILCARGGYGATRMLDLIDYERIKANPKIFIGYSDITAIINAIFQKTGLVCFHGPVGISTFNDFTLESFENVVCKSQKKHKYPYQREKDTDDDPEFDFYTISGGKAEGELVGGNLSVLASMIGTKFHPNFEGKIVYLEEIDEKTYKVDRMLTQLIQATNISKAAGIALGVFKNCNKNDKPTFTLKELLIQILGPLAIPTVYGFPFGHVENKMCLPNGINAKLDADKKTLKLIERAVV